MVRGKRKRQRAKEDGTVRVSRAGSTGLQIPCTVRVLVGKDRTVLTLPEFVAKYAPSLPPIDGGAVLDCTPEDADRIRRTLVSPCSNATLKEQKGGTASRSQSVADLVDEVIWSLVQRKSRDWTQRNVLDQGYTIMGGMQQKHHRTCPNMRPGVVCTQINDNVNFLKTSSLAESLYRMVGDSMMRTLLLQTSIFLPVEKSKDNFILLCGTARSASASSSRKKRARSDTASAAAEQNDTAKYEPNDCIPRQSLFYSHAFVPKIGLHTNHVMNQKDPTKLLSSIIQLTINGNKKRRKRWKRLRETAIPLCQEIVHKHERFDYHRTLNRYCPLPGFAKQDKKATVELADVGAAHTPPLSVVSFLQEVVRKVFPLAFWGSKRNLQKVLTMLETFVTLRRNERFPNKALVEGIRVTEIRWLWGGVAENQISTKSSHMAATTMLVEAMRWMVCHFVIPLLRSIFYVTESEFSAKRVLFYRKPVWSIFRNLSMKKLTTKQYRELGRKETAELLENQQMGLSRLKLLPKLTGVRPIAMMSKPDTLTEQEVRPVWEASTNTKLANTLEVLRHEYMQKQELFGAGQSGVNRIYPILRSFLAKVRDDKEPWNKQTKQKLYFASVDIEKCYDNVNQEYLLKIIEDVMQEDQYLIQRHTVMHPYSSLGRPIWRPLRVVGPLQNYDGFHELSAKLSPDFTESVFTNGAGCSIVKKRDMTKQLAEHLRSNLVAIPGRYGKRYFVQTCGIPQGSVLSSSLCNYYYGKMEKEILGESLSDTSTASTLIRIMDDFILITPDESKATNFLERMRKGNPELGVNINEAKSITNFGDYVDNQGLVSMAGRTFFPWCGMLIDTTTGEVRIDYTRFAGSKAVDGLTVDRCHVGKNVEIRIKTFVRPRCEPILFDSKINSFDVVVINFTQIMLLAARKSQELMLATIVVDQNVAFLRRAIDSAVSFARNLIIHRLQLQTEIASSFCLGEQEALWLGRNAFRQVFKSNLLVASEISRNFVPRSSRLYRAAQMGINEFNEATLQR
jgi:hypothetical protein